MTMSTSAETLMWTSAPMTTASTSSSDSESGSFVGHHPPTQLLPGEDYLNQGNQLRDEIRCSILQKRIQKGLGGIRLDWKANGPESLTKGEEDKRRQRRERNRVAASRCRERRRERTFVLVEETERLESSKQDLLEEIEKLQEQKAQLLTALSDHNHSGQCQRLVHENELHIDP